MQQPNFIDHAISQFDTVLRTLTPGAATATRQSPATPHAEAELSEQDRHHIAGLMRINHTGEVCAQALYQGQALTAKREDIRDSMAHAAEEEIDHLVWCEQRLQELGSRTSLLNPAFYAASFGLGAVAGAISDKISLGFVAATEDQVSAHLRDHLHQLPDTDQRSKAVLEQMLLDEQQHATTAIAAGGVKFPQAIKQGMTLLSKVMTKTTYTL